VLSVTIVLIFREYQNACNVTTEIITKGDFIYQVYVEKKKRVVVGNSEKGEWAIKVT